VPTNWEWRGRSTTGQLPKEWVGCARTNACLGLDTGAGRNIVALLSDNFETDSCALEGAIAAAVNESIVTRKIIECDKLKRSLSCP
jgi:hypothetical protein